MSRCSLIARVFRMAMRLAAWLCASALLLSLAFGQAFTQSAPFSLDDYWKQVGDTRQALKNNPAPAVLKQQAEIWSGIRQVTLAGGKVLAVDSSEIVRLLQADPPGLARLEALLAAMVQAHADIAPYRDGAAELKTLDTILARPEFPRPVDDNALTRLWKKIVEQFNRFLESIYAAIDRAGGRIPPWVGITLSLIVLAAILGYVFRGVWRSSAGEAALAEERPENEAALTATAAALRAQELSASGDYRLAVRYLYLSTLLLLDEHGLLRYDRSLTNREYLRQAAKRPDLAVHLLAVVEAFDRTWYGFQPVNEESYAAYLSHVTALEEVKP